MNFYKNRLQSLFLVHPKGNIPHLKQRVIKGLNNNEIWVGNANEIQVIGCYGRNAKSKYPFWHYYIAIVFHLTKNKRCYIGFHQHILMGKLKVLRFKGSK